MTIFFFCGRLRGTLPAFLERVLSQSPTRRMMRKSLPFCTHGGSGTAQSVSNIKTVCPDSEILQPLAVYGSQAEDSRQAVEQWLRAAGFLLSTQSE